MPCVAETAFWIDPLLSIPSVGPVYNCGFGLSKERRYDRKRRGWGGNLDTAPGGYSNFDIIFGFAHAYVTSSAMCRT